MKLLKLTSEIRVNPTEVASMKISERHGGGVDVRMRFGDTYFVQADGRNSYATLERLERELNEALQ